MDIRSALKHLVQRNIKSIVVEGGAQVITSLLQARLVDCFVVTIAPVVVDGLHPVLNLLKARSRTHANTRGFPSLSIIGHQHIGIDIVIWGTLA